MTDFKNKKLHGLSLTECFLPALEGEMSVPERAGRSIIYAAKERYKVSNNELCCNNMYVTMQ